MSRVTNLAIKNPSLNRLGVLSLLDEGAEVVCASVPTLKDLWLYLLDDGTAHANKRQHKLWYSKRGFVYFNTDYNGFGFISWGALI